MKAFLILGVVAGMSLATIAADKPQGTVTVMNLGALDEAALKGVEAYLNANVALPVHVVTLDKAKDLNGAMEAVAKARKPADGIVIALANLKSGTITLADADHALALVNPDALAKVAKSPVRVNLAVMRGLAAALGVGYGVDPHCVYHALATPADYDKLGGNFSPPTLQQVLLSAGEHGVVSTLPMRRHPAAK